MIAAIEKLGKERRTGSMRDALQFAIFETLHFWCGTGFRYMITSEGRTDLEFPRGAWLTYDVGLSLTFGGWRQRDALERQAKRRRLAPDHSGGS